MGALLTAALVAVSYGGWKVAGLPFAPFDIFDWFVRLLPGGFVTLVVDVTVAVAHTLGVANISAVAKASDQVLAIALLLGAGAAAGGVLFRILSISNEPALLFGGILGAMLGALALVAEQRLQRLQGSLVAVAWVFATFFAWGLAFAWAYEALRVVPGPQSPVSSPTDRRRFFLRLSVATLGSAVSASVLGALVGRWRQTPPAGRWSDDHALPNAASPVSPVPGTRVEFTRLEDHYRIDANTRAPQLDAGAWRLSVSGLVDRPRSFSLVELRALPASDQFVTLSCISNPDGGSLIGTTRWTGISLQSLLDAWALRPSATHLKLTSADGFYEVVSLEAVRSDSRVMLAYEWDGVPLPVEHGFPLRLYVPDVYGMKQPKWIVAVEALDHWEPGFWVARGWDRQGRVKTTTAVDAVVHRGEVVEVGGFAYAGARGISRVEVRADGGEWQEARLRDPISATTWVLWRAEFRLPEGRHRFEARAFDRVSSRA